MHAHIYQETRSWRRMIPSRSEDRCFTNRLWRSRYQRRTTASTSTSHRTTGEAHRGFSGRLDLPLFFPLSPSPSPPSLPPSHPSFPPTLPLSFPPCIPLLVYIFVQTPPYSSLFVYMPTTMPTDWLTINVILYIQCTVLYLRNYKSDRD